MLLCLKCNLREHLGAGGVTPPFSLAAQVQGPEFSRQKSWKKKIGKAMGVVVRACITDFEEMVTGRSLKLSGRPA